MASLFIFNNVDMRKLKLKLRTKLGSLHVNSRIITVLNFCIDALITPPVFLQYNADIQINTTTP